jgi:protein-disulfide isomerase-like protein with CxxC motif
MLAINAANSNSWGVSSAVSVAAASAVEDSGKTGAVAAGSAPQISTLARQLSEAAARAAARDEGKTRSQLASLEKVLRDEFVGDTYYANRGRANAEMPDTDDPELLARAKQATEFVNGRGTKNPFAGLSREQLSLIMYDKGDAFTINERHAAWSEHSKQYNAWASRVVAQAWNERQANGGKSPNFYKACIAEYQAGSAIEQSTYHPFYVARMEHALGLWESGGGYEDDTVSEYWKKSMEALMKQLPDSFGDDYSEGDKLWGAAPRAPNGLEIGSKQYDRNLSWGLTSKLAMPAASSEGNSLVDLYSQNQAAAASN